jgi:predicted transposase YdaD
MKRFDVSLKHLFEKYPRDWLLFLARTLGFASDGRAEVIDSDLATISAAVDKILRVPAPKPWLLHVDLQASHDPRLASRLLLYNVLLHRRHRLPVRSVVMLLRPEADRRSLTGLLEYHLPGDESYLAFRYRVIRLWQTPVESILQGGPGLLPLAPLASGADGHIESVIREMKRRVQAEVDEGEARDLWAATFVLLGLQYPSEFAAQLLRGVMSMKESSTYQAIIAEGRAEGRLQGLLQGKREMLIDQGTEQFGAPDSQTSERIQALDDLDYIKLLGKRILEVSSWDELLETPRPRPRSRRKKPS